MTLTACYIEFCNARAGLGKKSYGVTPFGTIHPTEILPRLPRLPLMQLLPRLPRLPLMQLLPRLPRLPLMQLLY
jgi:hypothetical protein